MFPELSKPARSSTPTVRPQAMRSVQKAAASSNSARRNGPGMAVVRNATIAFGGNSWPTCEGRTMAGRSRASRLSLSVNIRSPTMRRPGGSSRNSTKWIL